MFDSLEGWLAWMEGNHPRQIELGLDRVGAVARRLRLPLRQSDANRPARVFTVGGTNGKGSCVAILEAITRAQGLRVGAYSSPHLLRYNERVRIDGNPVSDGDLCRAFAAVHAALGGVSLTYFEFGTLAALWLFTEQPLDVWVLEVGLGGRLDAVNLVDSDAAAVVSVDLDHQDWLGDTREAIGYEKAGIFRAGRPAICADPTPPSTVEHAARALGAVWMPVGDAYDFAATEGDWRWSGPGLPGAPALTALPLPTLPLPSAAAALALLYSDGSPQASGEQAVRQGLCEARLPGRFQQLRVGDVDVVLDVCHNPHAARWLHARLAASPQPTRAVFAVMQDKAWREIVAVLTDQLDDWYVGDLTGVPRAAAAAEVAATLAQTGARVHRSASLVEAWHRALQTAAPGSRLLVFGSFYTVGAILEELGCAPEPVDAGISLPAAGH